MSGVTPFVTVVVPTLNEERYIESCLTSLIDGLQNLHCEIFVVDGGSTDRTIEIVHAMPSTRVHVSIVHNPKRLQSAAVNLAAALARPDAAILVRADAHARYPSGYVRTCVEALIAHQATSVVVPMITVGTTGLQRAVAAAQNSRLGNGGSAHRIGGASRFVDHGHHAAMDRAFFQKIGGYDETFSHNEDAEFDLRANRAGGRIWMCNEAAVTYFPRRTLGSVFRQYVNHGRGRARTMLRHRVRPKVRQMAPIGILFGCLASVLVAPFQPIALLFPLSYAGMCHVWGVVVSLQRRDPWLLAMGTVAMVMHIGWATGFVGQFMRAFGPARRRFLRAPAAADRSA